MINLYAIRTVAHYEAKLLWRSWAFRIFSLLGLFIQVSMCIGVGTQVGDGPYYYRALDGSMPLMSLIILNMYQGIIAVFLATEFSKRDRRHNTSQVLATRSFTNIDYLVGKILGISFIFAALNVVALFLAFIVDVAFPPHSWSWPAYLLYPLLLNLPTLLFMVGISIFLVAAIRSQAVVFVVMLGFSLISMIWLRSSLFGLLDVYNIASPLMRSAFIGMGNWSEIVHLRGAQALTGIGLILVSAFFSGRLKQARLINVLTAGLAAICLVTAVSLGISHVNNRSTERSYRTTLREMSRPVAGLPVPTVVSCAIDFSWEGSDIRATAALTAVNQTTARLDSLLFSLNPGLHLDTVLSEGSPLKWRHAEHLIWVYAEPGLAAGESLAVVMKYSGAIDERYCYLDIPDDRREEPYRFWLCRIPKRYAVISDACVQLTSEAGWYPQAGLSYGAAFPSAGSRDFTLFSLTLEVPAELTAVSQGEMSREDSGTKTRYQFRNQDRLPQISLAIAPYNEYCLEVDSVAYALYVYPGHEFYAQYFDQIADTLPNLIRGLKNTYEADLGLEYPYRRLSLVEAPVQFFAYDRLWTRGQETVQPEMVYLPESGWACQGTDFERMKEGFRYSQERANQAENPKVIQSVYLESFVKMDLLSTMQGIRFGDEDILGLRYSLLPEYTWHTTSIGGAKWPLLTRALESYFQRRVDIPDRTMWRWWQGLSDEEKALLLLRKISLAEMAGRQDLEPAIMQAAIDSKGRGFFARCEVLAGQDRFSKAVNKLVADNRGSVISEDQFLGLMRSFGFGDIDVALDKWSGDTCMAGYYIENINSYDVLDGERAKTQIKFRLTNPTTVDGVAQVSFRYRQQRSSSDPWMLRRNQEFDFSRMVNMPAMTAHELGFVLDRPPSEMVIETFVSKNIPNKITRHFEEQKLKKQDRPFDGDSTYAYEPPLPGAGGEYLIDNEDKGFYLSGGIEVNRLRKLMQGIFGLEESDEEYDAFRTWDPPGTWRPTTGQNYYGRFVKSAMYKRASKGESRVAWEANLDEAGDYDIYYYYEGTGSGPRFFGHDHRQNVAGEKRFYIYYEDGIEEIPYSLDEAEEGWNFLGSFRLLAGLNKIEMSDKNEANIVVADAIKWVRR